MLLGQYAQPCNFTDRRGSLSLVAALRDHPRIAERQPTVPSLSSQLHHALDTLACRNILRGQPLLWTWAEYCESQVGATQHLVEGKNWCGIDQETDGGKTHDCQER
jgi:hypothetical protein